jgi:proteasome lid subunit RPN8/RPN11
MGKQPNDIIEKVNTEERETSELGKVHIKMAAFRNMITHVLRFGNDAIDNSVEVMGICMGKNINKKEIVVENAIPITHGSRIEVGFSPEDYASFAQIDEQYADKGLFAVGWYHSHPGWGLFFSDSDVKNHLFYQKDQTPYSFGIVFDHTFMGKEGNLGFDIYRLKDHKKGTKSDYIKVAHEVEIPKTLDYYKWVQKFVEDSQKKVPILIKEINEITEPIKGDLQAIPGTEDQVVEEEEDKYPKVTPILKGFQEGQEQFSEKFMNIFKSQIGLWTSDVSKGTYKGTEFMRNTLSEMKDAITFGIAKVKSWFETNIGEAIDTFKEDVSEYIDTRIETQKQLVEDSSKVKEDINNEVSEVIQNNSKEILEKIDEKIKGNYDALDNVTQANSNISDLIKANSEKMSALANDVASISQELGKNIDDSITPFEETTVKEIEKMETELHDIKETYTKMKEMFDKLQKSIMDLRNI